jgi:fumarate reductase flavoprotein subunit
MAEMIDSDSIARVDVIVVGGGGTGLAAAIEARCLGRSVVLLEKNETLGGTTGLSVGSITATGTSHQLAAGVFDSPQDHFDDMPGFAGELASRDNVGLRKLLTDSMPDTFRWLQSLGLVFYGPMPEPPHRKPRMHTILPNSRAYIHVLERHARKLGVEIYESMRVMELIRENGRVVGVSTGVGGVRREFRARGGIILASGDYSASGQLKARFMSPEVAKVDPINPTSEGDGQSMGLDAGSKVLNGDLSLGPEIRFIPPERETFVRKLPPYRWLARFMAWSMDHMPQWLLRPFVMSFVTTWLAPSMKLFEEGAVLINANGEHFVDELAKPALALPDQPGKIGYILLDKTMAEKFSGWPYFISTAPGIAYAYLADYRRNRKDVYHSARSLKRLARKLDMDPETLEKAIEKNNAAIERGGCQKRPKLGTPPFVALGPVKSSIIFTDGGLAVNQDLQVLGDGDQPIAGLYAAGSAGQGGLLLEGHGHHLGWAFTSGRIAGRNAAYQVTSDDLP